MKYLIFLITFLILSTNLFAETLVVLRDSCYSQPHENINLKINEYLGKIKIDKYFLNCYSDCTEIEINTKFDKIWKKILVKNPEYLIVDSYNLWKKYSDVFIEYSEKHSVLVTGVFYDDSVQWEQTYSNFNNVVLEVYNVDITNVLNYFLNNAKNFKKFYIFRDSSYCDLNIAFNIRKQLLSFDKSLKVTIKEVLNLHQLELEILKIQNEEQGVIIPLINDLHKSEIDKILKIINVNNRQHIELGLLNITNDYLSLNYKNYQKNEQQMWDDFKNQKSNVYIKSRKLIINKKRLEEIKNGFHLLKTTKDFVDDYVDEY